MKLKSNEVGAVDVLSEAVKERVTPFFDLPRKEGLSEATFRTMVEKSARKMSKYLGDEYEFYVDNFDIPDLLKVNGGANYQCVIEEFSDTRFIPVVGLDRSPDHIAAVLDAKGGGTINSQRLGIRLLEDDFTSFPLVEGELGDLLDDAVARGFSALDLILDCRVCRNVNAANHAAVLSSFISQAQSSLHLARVVVSGSSIPGSIAEVAKVSQTSNIARQELHIVAALRAMTGFDEVVMGDYTIVSPMYSDVSMPPEMLLNVTAPKILYSHDDVHHVSRGGALRTHARGNLQYNDIAADIVAMPFYRGPNYSFGDAFLYERAQMNGSRVTPGSILKPTINAHITYMATDHPLAA